MSYKDVVSGTKVYNQDSVEELLIFSAFEALERTGPASG
jgi:hypothetical protein